MGMGEPLFNYDATVAALRLAMDEQGLNLSRRRITVSTSGVVPRIEQLGADLGVGLAISLHAVRDELRDELVPINRKWNIAALLDACRSYPTRRPITFEYVMLHGVNDSDADARELVRLLRDVPAKVNLIPFNPWPGAAYACSSNNRIHAFAAIVEEAGHASPVRTPRGRDILAACGQLRTDSQRRRDSACRTRPERGEAPAPPAGRPARHHRRARCVLIVVVGGFLAWRFAPARSRAARPDPAHRRLARRARARPRARRTCSNLELQPAPTVSEVVLALDAAASGPAGRRA